MRIIYSDIDNTFDSVQAPVPQINIDAIQKLKENGDRFVFVSGRNAEQIEMLLKDIGVDCDYIFGNGAGYRIVGQPAIYKNTIHQSILPAAKKFFDDNDLFYHFHTSEGVILEPIEKYKSVFDKLYKAFEVYGAKGEEMVNFKYNYFKNCFQVEDPFKYLENHKDIKLIKLELMEINKALILLTEKTFQELGLVVYSSFHSLIEIVPPESNKGNAIRSFNRIFNPVKTYGFGDGDNDIEMFEAVDVSIAVDNANESIKEKCNERTGSCESGGVGQYIFEHILK